MISRRLLFSFLILGSLLLISSRQKNIFPKLQIPPLLSQPGLEQERLYIQTDKPLYKPGETIWFAAHLRTTKDFSQNTPSEIVHVQIENPQGQQIFAHRLIAEAGIAAGDVQLAEQAVGGMYRIKAFTKWQLNEADAEIFTKEIFVQAAVLPRLKMKLTFLREGVGPGDEVLAEVRLENNQNKPLAEQAFDFELYASGEKLLGGMATTGKSGIGLIRFQLPEGLRTEDVMLQVKIPYQGKRESISRAVPIVMQQLELRFFPEGGGIAPHPWHKSRIAFKAMNSKGKATDVAGKILDRQGKEITDFRSLHQGMGSFQLHVAGDQQYFAKIEEPAGIDSLYPLPSINSEYALNLKSMDSQTMNFWLIAPRQGESVNVVISLRGHEYHRESYSISQGLNSLRLFTEGLPMGIARITIEDQEGHGLAERLIFVQYDQQAQLEIRTNKEKYLPREKVEVELFAKNSEGQAIATDLSIAVVDDQLLSYADDHSSNLLSWMLVESELTGKIEKPEFYFDPKEEKAQSALDMLMLTHGWRRFSWRESAPADSIARYAAERKEFRGRVIDGHTGKPVRGLKARLGPVGPWTDFGTGEFQFTRPENRPQLISLRAEGYRADSLLVPDYASGIIWKLFKTYPAVSPDTVRAFLPKNERMELPSVPGTESFFPPPPEPKTVAFKIPPPPPPVPIAPPQRLKDNLPSKPIEDSPEMVVEDVDFLMDEFAPAESIDETPEEESIIKKDLRWEEEPDINDFIFVSVEPEILNMEQIRKNIGYPDIARDAGIQGMLVVRVLVDESGNYVRHVMIKKVHPVLSQQVEVYLPLLKFTPAIQNNRPIKFWVNIPFRFSLNGGSFPSQSVYKIAPKQLPFHQAREFAFPDYSQASSVTTQTDFRNTLYWNPHLKLDAEGKGKFSFYTSDVITSYRITAEGFGEKGEPFRTEKLLYSQEPLQMDIRLPEALTQGDVLQIPVTLVNRYQQPLYGTLSVTTSPQLERRLFRQACKLAPGEAKTYYLSVQAMLADSANLLVSFENTVNPLHSSHQLQVRERGFPAAWSHQEMRQQAEISFPVQEFIDSSLHLSWVAYPHVMAEILDGMAAMVREPHGCFEQTSSATYPNVLALQLLRNSPRSQPELECTTLGYIEKGYKRLQSFEVGGGGFDWYGRGPAHEVLTAYGLMQFADMQTVWDGVDRQMLRRAVDWLKTRKNGKGGFLHQDRVFGTVAQRDPLGKDLFIVYSLLEAGFAEGFDREIAATTQQALESPHPFLRAMAANILATQENFAMAKVALSAPEGDASLRDDMPMGMGGQSLQAATLALRLQAMLATDQYSPAELEATAHLLRQCRRPSGSFGTTQSTVMALRALSRYEEKFQHAEAGKGTLTIHVNGKVIHASPIQTNADSLVVHALEKHIYTFPAQISVQISGMERPIPWMLRATYKKLQPEAWDGVAPLALAIENASQPVQAGGYYSMFIRLKNTEAKQQASSMARIGIPAGLSPQIWQLKEWMETERIAFYEWEKGYLTFYFYGLKAHQEIVLPLSLKADLAGSFTALPSSSYLYYTPEKRSWLTPLKVDILP